MKSKTTKLVVTVLALAGLVIFSVTGYAGSLQPAAPPAPTMKTLDEVEPRVPIHASDFPLTITEPNSYYLAEDVNFTDTLNDAITINCDDVTIDLMGYTLRGPDSGAKYGIYMNGRTNVEIRNGTIRDFVNPAIGENNSNGSSHRVVNIRVLSNGYGIYLQGSSHLVKDCTAADNGLSYGIYTSTGSTVTGNTAYNNHMDGIHAGSGSTVTGNTAYNNTGNGLYARDGCTVTGNTAYNNTDNGLYARDGCTVTGNTAYNNTDKGIYAGTYCLIDQNTAYSNGTNMTYGTGCQVGLNVAP